MNKLDAYQTLGVFVPGYFFSFGLYLMLKKAGADIPLDISSVGGSAALIVLSYVVGQIVQAFGNGFEWLWRKARPVPTLRVKNGYEEILFENQRQQLVECMKRKVGLPDSDLAKISEREWGSYVRSVESAVRTAKQAERVDAFNAHFGMFRGLVTANILLIIACFAFLKERHIPLIILGAVLLLSLYRMDRFDKNYAREVFQRFLAISKQNGEKADSPARQSST